MIRIEFLYPPALLFPNRPGSWRKKQATIAQYRKQCYLLALQYKPQFKNKEIKAHFEIWTTRKAVDLDNVLSACKRGIDSVAKAWGFDDKQLNPIIIERKGTKRGGQIFITFS